MATVNAEIERAEKEIRTLSEGIANLSEPVTEREVVDALRDIDPVWNELFPLEQERIVQLLVERVEVSLDGVDVRIRAGGLRTLVAELKAEAAEREQIPEAPAPTERSAAV